MVGMLAGLTYGIIKHADREHAAPAEPRRGFLDWLDTWFWKQEVKSREAFLAKSTDIVELEQRMRWLEHGRC